MFCRSAFCGSGLLLVRTLVVEILDQFPVVAVGILVCVLVQVLKYGIQDVFSSEVVVSVCS